MEIRFANLSDAEIISKLANEIWPLTYKDILGADQIQFMLQKSYTINSIEKQMKEGHIFFILELEKIAKGFASVTLEVENIYKLQKLYVHQSLHKQGAGAFLLTFVENYCKIKGAEQLLLNVNRNNKAKLFYKKMAYHIIQSIDIPYHHFVLNDYIMGKTLVH